ncbi:PaaI family thioesterase [Parasphingorhabdus halotolerans]|uniref:PaaI family thioesterase n=1 Tax=Parasphingorhabdus halotolerans TaxID=2725558 RepID=A0A6H2DNK7_9SPHN|nr:PaaI family thioesterase [Parasphingorhabdus halotolerans]QJB69573.1 PaaI family thioesterase [Parasphingorhabdus halotolerans]
MADAEPVYFTSDPDPNHPGWHNWVLTDPECYNSFLGEMIVRRGGDGVGENIARIRMFPQRRHRNLGDVVHGGTMMGFIDCSLFAAMRVLDLGPSGFAVTLELQTHFIGAARMTEPLEAQVEVTRETGRFLFMRGLVVQGDKGQDNMASFTAIVKKAPRKNAEAK